MSQYNPNQALKYDLFEKGQYFTVQIYLTLNQNNKNLNISIRAPLSADHIDIFQFIQKSVFDYNTCTKNGVPVMGNCDSH